MHSSPSPLGRLTSSGFIFQHWKWPVSSQAKGCGWQLLARDMWSGIVKCDCFLSWTLTAASLACSRSLSVRYALSDLSEACHISELIPDSCLVSPRCGTITSESTRVPMTPTVLMQPDFLPRLILQKHLRLFSFEILQASQTYHVPNWILVPLSLFLPACPVLTTQINSISPNHCSGQRAGNHLLSHPPFSLVHYQVLFFHFHHLLVSKFYPITPSLPTSSSSTPFQCLFTLQSGYLENVHKKWSSI